MKNNHKNEILISAVKAVKLADAGEKHSKKDVSCCPSSDSNVHYPSMYVNTKQIPDIKGMEVDDDIILIVKGKIVGHNLNENPKSSRESYDISIRKMGILEEKKGPK